MRVIEMTGLRIGHAVVLGREGTRNTFATWRSRCDCGVEFVRRGHDLRRDGDSASCGCVGRAAHREKVTTHGLSRSDTYRSWMSMRKRCNDPRDPSFARYGGRGIRVCARWNESFETFLEDMGIRPARRFTLDRKDVNGPYEKSNCRWATSQQQCRNRRRNHRVTFAGESLTITEWAERTGIWKGTIRERLKRGWSTHDALTMPADSVRPISLRKSA